MKHLLWILIWWSVVLPGSAQEMPYMNYTTHNGLPQIQVRQIYQDCKGYLWIGTKGGLAKFNGEHFHHYLTNDHIFSIQGDKKGTVYVYASSGFYKFDTGEPQQLAAPRERIGALVGEGEYLLYTSQWIRHYRQDTLYRELTDANGLPFRKIGSLGYDFHNQTIYVSDSTNHTLYRQKGTDFNAVFAAPEGYQALAGNLENDSLIYLIQNARHKKLINPHSGQDFFSYTINSTNKVEDIVINTVPYQNYILFHDYQFYRLDSLSRTSELIELPFIKAPYPVVIDGDGHWWAGSDNGLYQIWNNPIRLYPRAFMNDFWTLIEGRDGAIYGGAFKQGLYKLDLKHQSKQEILAPGPYQKKETDYYYGASRDACGMLYFPTHYGLVKYDYQQAKKFDTGISLITKYDPHSNRILFGQENGFAFMDARKKIESVMDETGTKIRSHPATFEFSGDSIIWIGTGRSLAFYHRSSKQITEASTRYDSCPHQGVISMAADGLQNIWMGTRQGLWLYRFQKNVFEPIDINGISGYITSVAAVGQHFLLIGTTRELFIMDLYTWYNNGQIRLKQYNFRNGMLAEEIAQNSFLISGHKVYIPSSTYTMELDLDKVTFENDFYNVAITHLNDTEISITKQTADAVITLKRGINNVDFKFETVGFGLPTTPHYRYQLEGYDKGWSDWKTGNHADYNNLASGSYTFHVEVRPGGMVHAQDSQTATIRIQVTLPFYREPQFYQYAFFAVLFLALIIGYIARERYLLKIRTLKHERQIQYLEVATLQAHLNPHFIFNLLASVQNLINQHKPEIANQYLIKFSRLIRAFMEASIKSTKGYSLHSSSNEISVKEEVDLLKMYIEFEQIKYRHKKFDFHLNVSNPDLLNKTIPPMIIQPFVENAIKHGIHPSDQPGKLEVLLEGDHDMMICTITDNGIGRKQSMEMQKQSIKAYESRGIELINRRVDVLNQMGYHIQIHYDDPASGGTIVKITFSA